MFRLDSDRFKNLSDTERSTYFQQRSGAVLFRSRNCFESSVHHVNRSPIRYTFCDAPFHYPVQCEHSLKLVLQYVTACGGCLKVAKDSGEPPICSWYCQACMRYKRVCNVHKDLFSEWLCDARPCEQCLRREQKCIRFSVLLSISDQAPCYEKYGRSVSSSLQDILDGQGKSEFPMRHIHDVGHHLKNAQASLERGTHFDGNYTYDSKDLWVAASTSEEQQIETLFKGLSPRALSQIDKHSEELALQRVSDQVISTVESVCSFVKTDIPELYKPWTSTSSNHSTIIGTPLFICISK